MATITVGGSGNWDSVVPNAPWPLGVPPNGGAAGDDVVINNAAYVLTIKGTSCVAKSIAVTAGTLGLDQTAANTLALYNGITGPASANSIINLDVSAVPSYTSTIITNGAGLAGTGLGVTDITTAGKATLKGASKTRWTNTTATLSTSPGTSIHVADATGWLVGDQLVFSTTQAYNATPRTDKVIITSITFDSGSAGPATIGWTGAVTYSHASGCYVGNFTSNLILRPSTAGTWCRFYTNTAVNDAGIIDHVLFSGCVAGGFNSAVVTNQIQSGHVLASESNNAFWDCDSGIAHQQSNGKVLTRQNNIYYSERASTNYVFGGGQTSSRDVGAETDCVIFRGTNGLIAAHPGLQFVRPRVSACSTQAYMPGMFDASVEGGDFWANAIVKSSQGSVSVGASTFRGTGLGTAFSGAVNGKVANAAAGYAQTFDTCTVDSTGATFIDSMTNLPSASYAAFINKGGDVTVQETYSPYGLISRSNSTTKRSASSVAIKPSVTGNDLSYTVLVPVAAGATVRVIGYCQFDSSFYNTNNYTAPTVTLAGTINGVSLTATPYTASSSANAAWEKFDLSLSNTSGADGNVTLTFTANAKAVTTGTVYFDGVPTASPFVTKARHYGFTYDQTTTYVTANGTIDPAVTEAAAISYGGSGATISVTWGTTSSTTISAATTFKNLYHFTQADACLHIGSALPLIGVGTSDSPSLFAQGNLTTTGYTLNGAGSISMGAYILAATGYSYTGGAFSQAATTPSFAGGALTLTTKVTTGGAFSLSGGTLKFGAAGADWNLSDAAYSGTITLATTAGQAVTVAMPTPSGFTIVNSEPGNITVTAPSVSVTAAWADAEDGTTVLLYNDSAAGALIDTATVSGGAGYSKTFLLPHPDVAIGDSLRIRHGHKQYYAGEILGQMTSTGWAALATQTLHPVYAAWGLDGATYDQANGGPFTMDGVNLQVDIASGATTGLKTQLAAWTQYLMTLPAGLDAFYGAWDLLSQNQIRQNVSVVDVKIDVPTAGALFTFTDNNVNYYRSDFTFPGNVQAGHGLIAMTYNAEPFVATVTGGNVITGSVTEVAGLVLAAAAISPIAANIEKVHGHTVIGTGLEADPWRPS